MKDLEDAVVNWFGEEVDEEIPLGVLKVTIPESWEKNIFIDPNAAYNNTKF